MNYTWLEVDLEQIAWNYRNIRRKLADSTQIIAVVKADAYGLGAIPIARKLEDVGCRHFAVTFFEEALALRNAGIQSDILVMMPVEPEEAIQAAQMNISSAMGDVEHARRVSALLSTRHETLRVHIKVDVGLSRMGIIIKDRFADALSDVAQIADLAGFCPEGIFTHLTSAGPAGDYGTLDDQQIQLFEDFTTELAKKGITLRKHCLCSDPLLYRAEESCEFIRIGTLLYGVNPVKYSSFGVRNCLRLKSRIVQVKEIPAGIPVSYGPLYVTDRPTKIAVVAIGFADGIRRALSNVGHMLVRGAYAPIIGKICCDHTILDVTDFPEVQEGDIVTIFGTDGQQTQYAGDYAKLCRASEPEITSILSGRIPRTYLNQ